MLSQVFVCLSLSRGVSVPGGLCPGGSLSRGGLCPRGVCPGDSVQRGSLSTGVSVRGGGSLLGTVR